MEGKSGILVVLIVLSILLLVASVVFGVLFGVKQTMVFEDYNMNLFVSLICAGLFVVSQIGIIVANNARITADNTYDILCRIDAILKEKGLTDADLARRDLKHGEKIAKKEAEIKAKMEAKALKEANREERLARIEEAKQVAIADAVAVDVATENANEQTTVAEEVSEPSPFAAETNEPTEPAQTYTYEEWKAALEGKVVCGECGGNYLVSKTKSGKIALACVTARREKGKCSSAKPISVDYFGSKFVEYVHIFFGDESVNDFNMDLFNKAIDSVTIRGGDINFKANEKFVEEHS